MADWEQGHVAGLRQLGVLGHRRVGAGWFVSCHDDGGEHDNYSTCDHSLDCHDSDDGHKQRGTDRFTRASVGSMWWERVHGADAVPAAVQVRRSRCLVVFVRGVRGLWKGLVGRLSGSIRLYLLRSILLYLLGSILLYLSASILLYLLRYTRLHLLITFLDIGSGESNILQWQV